MTKPDKEEKTLLKRLFSLGDKNIIDLLSALGLPIIGAVFGTAWGFYQYSNQESQGYQKTLDNYFTSLQGLQNDIFKITLASDTESKLEGNNSTAEKKEAKQIIQSLARAKTLIVLESLDPLRKGQVIQYLHDSGLVPRHSKTPYDSGSNNTCSTFTNNSILTNKDIAFNYDSNSKKIRVQLKDIELQDKALPGISFNGAGLKKINFKSSNLDCSSFKSTTIDDTSLENALMRGADFSDFSTLQRINFSGSVLEKANLSGAILKEVNFDKANLEKADLSGTKFQDVKNLTHEQIKSACNWEKGLYKFDKKWNNEVKRNDYIFNEKENKKYIEELKLDIKSNPKEQPNCV
jgi:hypothetical protein